MIIVKFRLHVSYFFEYSEDKKGKKYQIKNIL